MKRYKEALDPVMVGGAIAGGIYLAIEIYDRYKEYKSNKPVNNFKGNITAEDCRNTMRSISNDTKRYTSVVSKEISNVNFTRPEIKKGFKANIDYYILDNKLYVKVIGYNMSKMRDDYRAMWNYTTDEQKRFIDDFNNDYDKMKDIVYSFLEIMQKEYPKMGFEYSGSDGDHEDGDICIVSSTVSGARIYRESYTFRNNLIGGLS